MTYLTRRDVLVKTFARVQAFSFEHRDSICLDLNTRISIRLFVLLVMLTLYRYFWYYIDVIPEYTVSFSVRCVIAISDDVGNTEIQDRAVGEPWNTGITNWVSERFCFDEQLTTWNKIRAHLTTRVINLVDCFRTFVSWQWMSKYSLCSKRGITTQMTLASKRRTNRGYL